VIFDLKTCAVGLHAELPELIEFLDALLALIVDFIHRYSRSSLVGQAVVARTTLYDMRFAGLLMRLEVVVLHGRRFGSLAARQLFLKIGLNETVEFTIHDGGDLTDLVACPVIFDHLVRLEYI
jgi:hypothetical protein